MLTAVSAGKRVQALNQLNLTSDLSVSAPLSVSGSVQTADPLGGEGAPARRERRRGGAPDGALDVRRVFQRRYELLPGQGQALRKRRRA